MSSEESLLDNINSLSEEEQGRISCSGLPAYDPTVHDDYLTETTEGEEVNIAEDSSDNFIDLYQN